MLPVMNLGSLEHPGVEVPYHYLDTSTIRDLCNDSILGYPLGRVK